MIPVEGHSNLYRDPKSGAIINCDNIEYNRYMAQVRNMKNQKQEMANLKNEVSELKNMMEKVLRLLDDK
jgi:hypothetical protein